MTNQTSVDDYINAFPAETKEILEKVRETIRKVVPTAKEILSYGIPTFKLDKNLVSFAAYKRHIGFYPTSEALDAFRKELTQYKSAKGSVQFPLDVQIPYDLIAQITHHRVNAVKEGQG